MIFTIFLILAVLVLIACLAGYFYSTQKMSILQMERAAQEAADEARAAEAEAAGPAPSPPARTVQRVVVTASTHENLPVGTVLFRNPETNSWFAQGGNSQSLTDEQVRLLEGAHILGPLDPINTRDMTEDMAASFRAMQNDFTRMAEDMRRAFDQTMLFPPSARNNVARNNVNRAQSSPAPRPAPVPKATAKPVPKSAMERLLEDDLIPDDDPGVKPGS